MCLIPATIIPALLPIVSILGIAGAIVIIHKHNKWISERALDFNIKPYQFKKYLKSAIKFKDEEVMMGFSNAMNDKFINDKIDSDKWFEFVTSMYPILSIRKEINECSTG